MTEARKKAKRAELIADFIDNAVSQKRWSVEAAEQYKSKVLETKAEDADADTSYEERCAEEHAEQAEIYESLIKELTKLI